jgi:hypothetical protein
MERGDEPAVWPAQPSARRARSFARTTGAAILLVGLVFPRLGHAGAPFDLAGQDWEGCARLVEIAREQVGAGRVVVTDELDYGHLGAADGVLLLHPEGAYDVDELSTFMKQGGRLAIVDDFGDGDRLLERFRITRAAAPTNPLHMLRGNPQLPIAEPSSLHPIVADVAQVVLNHPTTVRHPDLSTLLRIPLQGGDAGPDVALAGQVGEGRLVAIGDPSMFINSMVRYPGNRAVARNLAEYLVEGSSERRGGARLFIVTGHFKEKGTLGGGIGGGFRERLRSFVGALDAIRKGGFTGLSSRFVAMGVVVAAALWVAFRASGRAKLPRPRFAASDSTTERLGYGADDPRIARLVDREGTWLFGRTTPSVAGAQALLEGIEAAIGGDDELRSRPQAEAIAALARRARLSGSETRLLTTLVTRLRAVSAGVTALGPGAWRLSAHELRVLGRVLAAARRASDDERAQGGDDRAASDAMAAANEAPAEAPLR